MNSDVLKEIERLWRIHEKIGPFETHFKIAPVSYAAPLIDGYRRIAEQLPIVSTPQSISDVHGNELNRKLNSEATRLEHVLTGKRHTLQSVVEILGLESEDLDRLKPWLVENKPKLEESVRQLFEEGNVETYELPVPTDIPYYRTQAEANAERIIRIYHRTLANLVNKYSNIGDFIHKIEAHPTTLRRSYFNPLLKTLAVSAPEICYVKPNGTLHSRAIEIINLMGHEGLAHALQEVITSESTVPFYLLHGSEATISAQESISQHFDRVVFDDLMGEEKIQAELGLDRPYDQIYRERQSTQLISDYKLAFLQYAIVTLANKELGDPKDLETLTKKIDILREVALYDGMAIETVYGNKDSFDPEGNLEYGLARELVYCSQAVSRVLSHYKDAGVDYLGKSNRSRIDRLLLEGYFTPKGLVEKAQVDLINPER